MIQRSAVRGFKIGCFVRNCGKFFTMSVVYDNETLMIIKDGKKGLKKGREMIQRLFCLISSLVTS